MAVIAAREPRAPKQNRQGHAAATARTKTTIPPAASSAKAAATRPRTPSGTHPRPVRSVVPRKAQKASMAAMAPRANPGQACPAKAEAPPQAARMGRSHHLSTSSLRRPTATGGTSGAGTGGSSIKA